MKKKGLGDHQRFQYLHCGFAFSALVACFVRCVFRVFPCVSLCVRPSVTSRDLYTMLFPVSFQWTPPHPPRSPRMHCGFPEAFASTVHQTIPANFRVCFPMRLCWLPRTPPWVLLYATTCVFPWITISSLPRLPPPPRFPYFPIGVFLSFKPCVRSQFHLRSLPCAFFRHLALALVALCFTATPRWRDPTKSKELPTVAWLSVWTLSCPCPVKLSMYLSALLTYFSFWLIRSHTDPTYTNSIFVCGLLSSFVLRSQYVSQCIFCNVPQLKALRTKLNVPP